VTLQDHLHNFAQKLPTDLEQDRVIGTAQAAAYLGYSTSHFRALVAQGRMPKPIRLSSRKLGWRVSTLRALIDSKSIAAA
jgi:prophage regulatory protein